MICNIISSKIFYEAISTFTILRVFFFDMIMLNMIMVNVKK